MAAYSQDVGRRMREARERNRPDLTSQEAAARELDVSSKQYGRWERGESTPRSDKWELIAEMLRVPVDELRGEPPAIPEDDLRAQLDRIEATVNGLADQVGAIEVQLAAIRDAQAPRKRRGGGSGTSRASES